MFEIPLMIIDTIQDKNQTANRFQNVSHHLLFVISQEYLIDSNSHLSSIIALKVNASLIITHTNTTENTIIKIAIIGHFTHNVINNQLAIQKIAQNVITIKI